MIYDRQKVFSSKVYRSVVAIESKWFETAKNTTFYLYEFNTDNFYFDEVAGFYVSEHIQIPVMKYIVDDIFKELFKRNAEVRILDDLWSLADSVKISTLNWSLCRMRNAKKEEGLD